MRVDAVHGEHESSDDAARASGHARTVVDEVVGEGALKAKGAKQMTKHPSMPAAQKVVAKPRRKRDLFSERKFGGLAARVNNAGSTSKASVAGGDKENAVRRFAR